MIDDADLRLGRDDERELWGRIDPFDATIPESGAMVVVTVDDGAYPTTSPAVLACKPATAIFEEREGLTASIEAADPTDRVYVCNITTDVPPPGTTLLATPVGDRWVCEYYGEPPPP